MQGLHFEGGGGMPGFVLKGGVQDFVLKGGGMQRLPFEGGGGFNMHAGLRFERGTVAVSSLSRPSPRVSVWRCLSVL